MKILDPSELDEMPSSLFCEWVAYFQIQDGTFETQEQREEKAKKEEEQNYENINRIMGMS